LRRPPAQAAVAVHGGDTTETLAGRVLEAEHRLYPLALRLVAEGRVRLEDNRCIVAGAPVGADTLIVPSEAG
jgi:phosphoribosylglycinamide formyltransferase 1